MAAQADMDADAVSAARQELERRAGALAKAGDAG
jgi:hypothetical protein